VIVQEPISVVVPDVAQSTASMSAWRQSIGLPVA
jgi:hypothetical protein